MNVLKNKKAGLIAAISAVALLSVCFISGSSFTAQASEITPHDCSADDVCYPNSGGGFNARELKQIGWDISQKGKSSPYYKQFHDYMQADSDGNGDKRGTIKTTNGNVEFRLIGINHDDRADGKGKAGLTFMATDSRNIPTHSQKNNYSIFYGGWRDSNLRYNLNEGDIWQMMPKSLRDNVTPVIKYTNNGPQDKNEGYYDKSALTATVDKLFLLSYKELVPTPYNNSNYWEDAYNSLTQEGKQYEFFKDKVTNNYSSNTVLNYSHILTPNNWWWERSANPWYSYDALHVYSGGNPTYHTSVDCSYGGVVPALSF